MKIMDELEVILFVVSKWSVDKKVAKK